MRLDMKWMTSRFLWVFQGLPLAASAAESIKSASTPTETMQPLGAGYLVQFGLGLLVVLMTVVALVWVLRRVGQLQTSYGGSLKTLGGLSLGARERVVLIQVGDTQLLLGVAPGRIQTLHVLDTPLIKTSGHRNGESEGQFAKRLASAMKIGPGKQEFKQ
jgi:flagellar protein FliO/FliZ